MAAPSAQDEQTTQGMSKLSLDEIQGATPPAAPRLASGGGIVAFDITKKFAQASHALSPGELVKDGFFTLFEGVGALEIMDPKMDSGCLEPGESLHEEYDVSKPLLPEEVLGIIDQLLCLEMAWHVGYPLSQTILTSVYVEAILMPVSPNIECAHFIRTESDSSPSAMHDVLRAYCLGLLKTCGEVNERIINEHYYEEEDFVTNTYHRNLLEGYPIETIQEAIKNTVSKLETLTGSVSAEMIEALKKRLMLRFTFLSAIDHTQFRTNPDLIKGPWEEAVSVLGVIKDSHALAKPVPEAFSAKLQRRLASTMPPRPIVELSFEDAFGHLSRLFKDGVEVIDVLRYHDSLSLQTFVMTFQAKKPQPLIFIRTLLQSFLFKDMEVLGHMSIRQLMDNDLSIITLPSSILLDRANDDIEAPQDPRFIIADQMETFRLKAAQPYLDILRTFCQNRCRVRRTLCHMIADWETLQFDAEDMDSLLQNLTKEKPIVLQGADGNPVETYALPLSSWSFLYKIKQMEWIVQLGFELEVYQPDELSGMYWYLEYLSRIRLSHVERIKGFILQAFNEARSDGRQLTASEQASFTKSLAFIRLNLLDAAVTCELADAFNCLHAALQRLNLIKPPPRPYSTDELRYELRMKPFAVISHPPLPSFEEFNYGKDQAETPVETLLLNAEKGIAGAKRGFEAMTKLPETDAFSVGSHDRWLPGVKGALKSCIAANIAVMTLQKAVKASGYDESSNSKAEVKLKAEVPEPEKAYHEWWIVPKLSPAR